MCVLGVGAAQAPSESGKNVGGRSQQERYLPSSCFLPVVNGRGLAQNKLDRNRFVPLPGMKKKEWLWDRPCQKK